MAAGDTFRAAAAEQLGTWAERAGADVVRGAEGGDPSSVIFDAIERAAARGADLVLADTAGRLHTKIEPHGGAAQGPAGRRPSGPGNVTEVLLVLDATTGQNGLVQARQFTEAVEVTGVVLTKLDGSAKGGIVFAIQSDLGIPVKLVGLGETADDLVEFDPDEFVDALFSDVDPPRLGGYEPMFLIRLVFSPLRIALFSRGSSATAGSSCSCSAWASACCVAPTTGAELRAKLRERIEAASGGGAELTAG